MEEAVVISAGWDAGGEDEDLVLLGIEMTPLASWDTL